MGGRQTDDRPMAFVTHGEPKRPIHELSKYSDANFLHSDYFCNSMKYSELRHILKNHKLRITDCRMDVLEFFLDQKKALSMKNLEDHFKGYDRVTLYRTLNSFTENGVLHKIPDDSGFATYGVCHTTCDSDEHHHNHMHFKCDDCGNIECLDEHLPTVKLSGYRIREANMILNGICKTCGEN